MEQDKEYRSEIQGLTIAVTHMEAMVYFYEQVFLVTFQEQPLFDAKLYYGTWLGLNLTLCPAKIAGITASQNRHQFDIVVTDLEAFVNQAIANGGKLMGEVQKDDTGKRIGLKDPDGNSMVIIEKNE